jgi:phytoene synthase
MRFQAERAHRCYDEALALLPEVDRRRRSPA